MVAQLEIFSTADFTPISLCHFVLSLSVSQMFYLNFYLHSRIFDDFDVRQNGLGTVAAIQPDNVGSGGFQFLYCFG